MRTHGSARRSRGDLVAEVGQLLLARQQLLALGKPLLPGHDGMVRTGMVHGERLTLAMAVVMVCSSMRVRGRRSRDRLGAGCAKDGSDKCGGIRMDSLITAAARALAAGDPLGALNRVALRDDAPALALRGIAMAQLGDFVAREGAAAARGARLRPARGGGPRALRRRRGRDRARLARSRLADQGARCGAGDARAARRPR